jgi:hypothetical protein
VVASTVFIYSVVIERNHTVNDETMGQFKKLTILQFINIGLIILIINIDIGLAVDENGDKELFLGFLPIFNGTYGEFNSEWYSQVGKTLCLTLLINIFSPHASKIMLPFVKLFFRCLDRGCSCKLWKKPEKDADIDVNTKKVL